MPRPPISNPPLHSWASTSLRRPSRISSASTRGFPSCARIPVLRVLAASPQPSLLHKFTSVRIGDNSTIALPDQLADQFPGCGGFFRAGLPRCRSTYCGTSSPARSYNCESPSASRTLSTRSPRRSPRPNRCRFDLGYLSGSVPEPHASRCFLVSRLLHVRLSSTPRVSPLRFAILRQQTGSVPISCQSAMRELSPALPIDRSTGAPRNGRTEATESLREDPQHGRVPSREYLIKDWTIFVIIAAVLLRGRPSSYSTCSGRSNLCSYSGSHKSSCDIMLFLSLLSIYQWFMLI